MFIIGSSDIDDPGELYVVDINSISRSSNRRNKRLIDLLVSFFMLPALPLLLLIQRRPAGLFTNLIGVIANKLSWVGFDATPASESGLPSLKQGVLHPS
ncbi:MAG: hypothetical protein ACKO7B_01255, partial [Flavobacteriales bacterium]